MSSAIGQDRPKLIMLPSPEGGRDVLRLSAGMEQFVGRYPLIPEFAKAGGLFEIRDDA
jgi:hypothetical protein